MAERDKNKTARNRTVLQLKDELRSLLPFALAETDRVSEASLNTFIGHKIEGVRSRKVYLPAGASWTDLRDGTTHPGGTTIEANAPLESIPVFTKVPSGTK